MLDTFRGLPVHALIVHATVVTLPTAALLVALAAVHPRFRRWIGPVPAIAAVVAVILVPLTTASGNNLMKTRDPGPSCAGLHQAIAHHKELAGWLIWLVLLLAVLAIVGYLLHRRGNASKGVVLVVAVLSVLSAGAVAFQVARVGEAGAKAVWTGQC